MEVKEIKKILRENKVFPSKRLGQNFLIAERIISKIIEAADLSKNDILLEIGPGIGNLTLELAKRVKKVLAVEKDLRLVEILKKLLEKESIKNVEIIEGDIRKISLHKLGVATPFLGKDYKVVANLPFYLTCPVIRKFLEEVKVKPQKMILLVQKEVAQRICAKPKKMNLLAISVQFYAKPEIISYVKKEFFWPRPKVDGAVIKIIPYPPNSKNQTFYNPEFINSFFKIVKAGFSHPRKQIINNLTPFLKRNKIEIRELLLKSGIKPNQRAENLTLKTWIKLTENLISF